MKVKNNEGKENVVCCNGSCDGVDIFFGNMTRDSYDLSNDITVKAAETETNGTCGENLTWNFDEATGTLTISGTGSMTNYGAGTGFFESGNAFPWYSFKSSVKKVIVNDGVTSIESYAFYGYDVIETVEIADSVRSIYSKAFKNCKISPIFNCHRT